MKQKRLVMLDQMFLLMIEYPKHDWHSAFGHKILCYSRATGVTFILNLLYTHETKYIFHLSLSVVRDLLAFCVAQILPEKILEISLINSF